MAYRQPHAKFPWVKFARLESDFDADIRNTVKPKVYYRQGIRDLIERLKEAEEKINFKFEDMALYKELELCCITVVFDKWLHSHGQLNEEMRNQPLSSLRCAHFNSREVCSKCALKITNWDADGGEIGKTEDKLLKKLLIVAMCYMAVCDNRTFWDLSDAIDEMLVEEEYEPPPF